MTTIKDEGGFATNLDKFKKAASQTMKLALALANYSIVTFEKHGDLGAAQRFLDAMPKNFIRRAAYLKWLAAHSPLTMEQGQLKKDKSEDATAFDVEGALQVSFWDFAPDQEDIVFEGPTLVAELNRVIKKYKGDKYAPKDDAAKDILAKAERLVGTI